MTELKPLTTPWDDMPREELVREMQKAYSALVSAWGILAMQQETNLSQPYWRLPNGRGGQAVFKAEAVFAPYKDKYEDWQFYRTFFRTADALLFPTMGENWVVCPVCGTMTQSTPENDARKVNGALNCNDAFFNGQGRSCAGTVRWMNWEDIEKWKKEANEPQ